MGKKTLGSRIVRERNLPREEFLKKFIGEFIKKPKVEFTEKELGILKTAFKVGWNSAWNYYCRERVKEKTKEQIVKDIDYLVGRYYDLCNKKEPLTETEQRELRGYGIKFNLFKLGTQLSGMSIKEYLSLTDRDWGDNAQKEIAEGKRQWNNRTEEELKESKK